jgi:hypothetical protein
VYAHYELTQPALVLRARFRIIDPTTRSLLDRARLAPADVECARATLLARLYHSDHPTKDAVRAELLTSFLGGLDHFAANARSLDANLVGPIDRTRDTVTHAVDRLLDRYERARVERDEIAAERATRLQAVLYPNGEPQERVFGPSHFVAQYGLAAFKALVLDNVHLDQDVRDLYP